MSTPRFAIYYADGSVHEGGGENDRFVEVSFLVSEDWLNAPADRVLGVIVEKPTRVVLSGRKADERYNMRGVEWYYPLEHGEYGFADDIGAWLRKWRGIVKRGEYVSSEVMETFWAWANNYARIPRPTNERER